MSDSGGHPRPNDVPTVTCSRCDDAWTLSHELDDLAMGNRAVEAFAIDHQQHTGHFPDDVSPWLASCRRCPDGAERLAESGARRWAETHARHTGHAVALDHASRAERELIEPGE